MASQNFKFGCLAEGKRDREEEGSVVSGCSDLVT